MKTPKFISDKDLLSFEWPPRMLSFKPKQKKRYKHIVTVAYKNDPETGYEYHFTSDKKARNTETDMIEATNVEWVAYDKKEIIRDEEGYVV